MPKTEVWFSLCLKHVLVAHIVCLGALASGLALWCLANVREIRERIERGQSVGSSEGLHCVSSRTGAFLSSLHREERTRLIVQISGIIFRCQTITMSPGTKPWSSSNETTSRICRGNHRVLARMSLKIRFIYKIARSMLS